MDFNLFRLTGTVDGEEIRRLVVVRYGRNGGATAYAYHSGDKLGRATGGGYDITATALEDAARKLYGTPRTDGAAGLEHVRRHLAEHGVDLATATELLYCAA